MNQILVNNWNEVVGLNDIVFFLGDLGFFKNEAEIHDLIIRLRARIHFITGNHDQKIISARKSYSHLFESVQDYEEISIDNIKVVLSHYPMLDWSDSFAGSFQLHGHVHSLRGDLENKCRRYDVGVDNNNYFPVNFEDIYKKLVDKPKMCINTIRDGVPMRL